MDQLKQLHRELNVAKTPGSQLELSVCVSSRYLLLYSPTHGLNVLDEAVSGRDLPNQRLERRYVRLTQGLVAGHWPRLEQRLELPGLGPATVVGEMTGQRADERAGVSLGAQSCVDLPQRTFGRSSSAGARNGTGKPCRRSQRGLLIAPGSASATYTTSTSLT